MHRDSYTLFCCQLPEAVSAYPNLKIDDDRNGRYFLKGILDILNDQGIVVDNFLIEIHYSNDFPFRFPTLYETGGRIPNVADWHKYTDDSCCITVLPDEILKCKNGITVVGFIDKHVIPYFANYIYKKQTGQYKNGEYGHGTSGIFQFYKSVMKTGNRDLWIQCLKNTFGNEKAPYDVDGLCFCGSRRKFKDCHLQIFNTLQLIGQKQIINDFKLILT